jgi:hypothetical protein
MLGRQLRLGFEFSEAYQCPESQFKDYSFTFYCPMRCLWPMAVNSSTPISDQQAHDNLALFNNLTDDDDRQI